MNLFQKKVPILHHNNIGPGYFKMGLAFPELAQMARPGQFVMVRCTERHLPLLRRPFSVYNRLVEREEVRGFELLYKVVGQGTRILSEMKAGETVDVLGPLGNGFSCPEDIRHVFLVAGGIGVASLYYLALYLRESAANEVTLFLGGRSAADVLCHGEFESLGTKVCITTEDGSCGEKGVVTSSVQRAMENDVKPDMIYACGPQAMLEGVGDIASAHNITCQVSLESAMACGFGVCRGCAVEKAAEAGRYFHVCTDGPVFDFKEVRM